jgi:hypothetical protein
MNISRWKLAEIPLVNEFILCLRDKVVSGDTTYQEYLISAIQLCGKVSFFFLIYNVQGHLRIDI